MLIPFKMTQHDIATGLWCNCAKCPVAKCIARTLGVYAYVTPCDIRLYITESCAINDEEPIFRTRTPKVAAEFIDQFDRPKANDIVDRRAMTPIEFSLKIPKDAIATCVAKR